MARSKPEDMAATRVIAIISSMSVTPLWPDVVGLLLVRANDFSRLQDASAETFEREASPHRAVHPPDFELNAVEHPTSGASARGSLEGVYARRPSGGHSSR